MKKLLVDGARAIFPKSLSNKFFDFGFQIAPEQFEKFCYLYGKSPKMELGLAALRNRGFEPKTIFDVGAFEGTFCQMARRIWPNSQIVMFEANDDKKPIL